MSAPAGRNALVLRVAGDVSVAVPNNLGLLTTYVLLEQETWFEEELGFLRRCLRPGLAMLDVGANYGMYSLPLARLAGPQGRVWSVEPARETAEYLSASAAMNGLAWMQVIRTALSDRIGSAHLKLEADSEMNALVDAAGAQAGGTEEVPLTTLDALAGAYRIAGLEFLKLDAEGEEARIVAGGAGLLARESPLLMVEIKHGKTLNLHLVEVLAAAGYASYRLVPGLDLLAPFDPRAAVDPYQLNMFACKPDRAARLARDGWLVQAIAPTGPLSNDPSALHRDAHDPARAPQARLAALMAADAIFSAACDGDADAWTLGGAARVAWELGERRRALALLSRADQHCAQGDPGTPAGAVLAPTPAFDSIADRGRPGAWLGAAVLDQFVSLAAYSTRFSGPEILTLLERIKASGFLRAPMERRRQLMRTLKGLQPGPQPDPLLAQAAADHLNPGLWGAPTPP